MGLERRMCYTVICDRCKSEVTSRVGRTESEAEDNAREVGGMKFTNGNWVCKKCLRLMGTRL